MKINIITGEIRSGKTTILQNLILSYNNVEGIIQPTIGENRFFQDIKSKQTKEITSQKEDENTFVLGRFLFKRESFIWAKEILKNAIKNKPKTIVVDEFGPLELNGNGLEPVVSEIIEIKKKGKNIKLIIIIRENLIKDFLRKFDLAKNTVEIIKIGN